MIKPNDLRIGNIIFPRPEVEEYVTVTDIDEDGNIGTTAFFYDGRGTTGTTTESARGIPLTYKLLKQCGWIGSYNLFDAEVMESASIWHDIHYEEGKCTYVYNGVKLRDIEYLHQLQNLYHSLTGKEITLMDKA